MRPKWIPWLIVALMFSTLGGVAVWEKIRGYRNRNPGNIKRDDGPGRTGTRWKGLAPITEQTDPVFWRFLSAEWGIRALRVTLVTYRDRYNLNTIRGVISRYAPGTENDTAAYIRAVSQSTGFTPDTPLTYPRDLEPLVRGIIRHELGFQPYSDAVITEGLTLT